MAAPTASGALDPSRRSSILATPLEPYAGGRVSTAHHLHASVVNTDGSTQTAAAFFSATASLLPAREAIVPHVLAAGRGVAASPLRQRCQDLPNQGKGCVQGGDGCMACFGQRPCPGGAMGQRPWCPTCERVSALFLDVLPLTSRAWYAGPCPGLPLTIRMSLCGGA